MAMYPNAKDAGFFASSAILRFINIRFAALVFKPLEKSYEMSRPSTALKRLMNEYKELCLNSTEGITAGPISESNYFEWEALIQGPEETPYEGGIFAAKLSFPPDYPLMPPKMQFTCSELSLIPRSNVSSQHIR